MPSVSLAVDRAPLIVALDAGTSSVRALAFDNLGHAIGETEEQIPYGLETTQDGGATFPAERLFDLTVKAIDGVVARLDDAAAAVAAVGSTSFWHSLMGIDATGTPTTPVFYWADTRSSQEATRTGSTQGRAPSCVRATWSTGPSTTDTISRSQRMPRFQRTHIFSSPRRSARTVSFVRSR